MHRSFGQESKNDENIDEAAIAWTEEEQISFLESLLCSPKNGDTNKLTEDDNDLQKYLNHSVAEEEMAKNKEKSVVTVWTEEENRLFERLLVEYTEEVADRWEKVAAEIPGKSAAEVEEHYDALVHDVNAIDLGYVAIPNYPEDYGQNQSSNQVDSTLVPAPANVRPNPKVKKYEPWSILEHRLFLIGLRKYGKGKWKKIAGVVGTRDKTQVGSHAQKYFAHQNDPNKNMKRKSIHDLTIEDI